MNPLGVGDPLRLGPYRIIGVLGEGGMGKVYLATDKSGRPAAVKVLRPELAHDQHLAQRFVREAHTAQAVTGKGVARVLAAQMEGGRPWIATEFLAGPTLEEAVAAHGALDDLAVRALASSLAEALEAIHSAGLVHRDIKPANIVLTSDGPRVIDFGIARPEHGLTLTTTGQIPVTPGYGAPEQVLGQRVTGAADVFSLGAVLVFAATGRRTFTGPHVAAVQYAVVHAQPDLGSLSPQLAALVAPCLAKEPALRPSPGQIARVFSTPKSARTLWRQGPVFQEIKRRESAVHRQTASAESSVERLPARRRFLAWGLGGAVLTAGGGGSAWWLTERAANALPPAGDAPDAALLKAENEGIRPKPLWGPVEAAARGPLPTPVVLRDVVILAARDGGLTALEVTDGTQKWTLPHLSPRARQFAVDRDHFAAADESGRLFFIEASTSAEKWSVADADVALLLAADAGGIYFLTKKGKLRAVDTAGRKVRWTGPSVKTTEDGTGPLAAAGRNRLVLSLPSGDVSVVDTTTGRSVWEIRGQGTTALQPLVDGDTVYLGGRTLAAVALAEGRQLWAVDAYTKPEGTEGGWGPPALDGEGVIAADGAFVYRFTTSGTRDTTLFADLKGTRSPLTPPVIQGHCIWVIEGMPEFGVSALSKPSDKRVWTYERDDRGPWTMTGAGNRVFLISRGKVVAMPVF
ncbi:serine/threonine-protein kinase [Streptomyces lateritius]|uniref:serine/threonine-protein kinase n=1 Tax=Streptomyces lateritius TaxID=67313 RepID=UPI001671E8FB|nr:serine/threonine-protein kinase [Streptomyces lateritius]GGT90886.1 hypothetical protein GCM10010272_39600 [Streptomyces lateritius]